MVEMCDVTKYAEATQEIRHHGRRIRVCALCYETLSANPEPEFWDGYLEPDEE